MSSIPGVELSTMRPEEIPLVAGVAARGMRDNPSSVAMMGQDPVRREKSLEPLFRWVLLSLQRPCLVARRGNVIVGLAALAPPGLCFYQQITDAQRVFEVRGKRVSVGVPAIPRSVLLPLLRLGPATLGRISRWGEVGMTHHPAERHQHVELVAVEAGLQGLGIGSLMMEELCRQMDRVGEMAYLETDKEENIRFYQRFDFELTGESTVLDTTSWYMRRPPAS